MNKSIIIRVNAGNRFGFGHLSRCISLFKILNRDYDVQVVVLGVDEAKNILESQNIDYIFYKSDRDLIKLLNSKHVDLVITDIRDTKSSFTQKIRKYSKLLSIDDLGDGSNYSNLTVNTLPIPTTSKVKANFSGLKYLILNENLFRYRDKGIKKGSNILVSFGGEDPYGLTEFTTTLISNLAHTFNVKIVLGPLYKGKETFDNVQIIKSPDNFYEILCDSDLVICSFGITVYECIYIGIPVVTINPTDYHNNLAAQVNGIYNLGIGNDTNKIKVSNDLENVINKVMMGDYNKKESDIDLDGVKRIANLVDHLVDQDDEYCIICKHPSYVYNRDNFDNNYYCMNCHIYFRSSNYHYYEEYNDNYFTEQYKKQYGKTYLEDKANINKLNKERLKIIKKIIPPEKQNTNVKLIELGSAMGFFIEMARDDGYNVSGVEISNYACQYAINKLNLKITEGNFNDFRALEGEYDILVAWYFIEHNPNILSTLKKMKSLLKKGGLIALSTPNVHGISYLSNKNNYINNIPKDHYMEFSPRSLTILLEKLGFKVIKLHITGLHFNRFANYINNRLLKYSWMEKPVLWIMAKLRLGDTFEIYARKN